MDTSGERTQYLYYNPLETPEHKLRPRQEQRRRNSLNHYLPSRKCSISPETTEEEAQGIGTRSLSSGNLNKSANYLKRSLVLLRSNNPSNTFGNNRGNYSMYALSKSSAEAAAARLKDDFQGGVARRINSGVRPSTKKGRMKLLRSSSTISNADSSGSDEESSLSTLGSGMNGEFGLQIYPTDVTARFSYCYDANFAFVHPNAFAPAMLTDVTRLSGGGSGIAVFSGTHPELGDLVMKHGCAKDLQELFALLTIAEELKLRGRAVEGSEAAAVAMRRQLPSFAMIYISPHHIALKNKELWGRLKKIVSVGNLLRINLHDHLRTNKNAMKASIELEEGAFLTPGMSIRIYEQAGSDLAVVLDTKSRKRKPSLAFVVPKTFVKIVRNSTLELDCFSPYKSLKKIYDQLLPLMTDNLFKFTLAQKRIGGPHARTGNQWLYEGKLKGKVLDNLVSQFCHTVQNLQQLTLPEEVDVMDQIRAEVKLLEEDDSTMKAEDVSIMTDQFTGCAIRKNFHCKKGRLPFFRRLCKSFREKSLYLTPNEEIPAMHLGNLMLKGALMSDTFVGASTEPTLLQPHDLFWRHILARSVENRRGVSKNALKRIWTSGLTDAGIHNLFVSEDDLYFFDLGEPQLQSMPGFMTKFLFSFFHTLGMQENENKEWVPRFVATGNKLDLTEGTRELLDDAYDAFEVALDRIIEELFDGDNALRWLLLQYVTLQLLSDAAFCLSRWEVKGGGHESESNHNNGLQRWLWRALWDCYVAFDINTAKAWDRFGAEDPEFMDSICDSGSSFFSDAGRFTPLSGSDRRSSFGQSLRDLTLSTYFPMNAETSSSEDPGTEDLSELEEDSDEDDASDDDSAIGPHDSSSSNQRRSR